MNDFTTFLIQHYDDSINWAFSSAVKNKELAASNDDAGVAIIQGDGDMTLKVPMTLENTVAFLQNMKVEIQQWLRYMRHSDFSWNQLCQGHEAQV